MLRMPYFPKVRIDLDFLFNSQSNSYYILMQRSKYQQKLLATEEYCRTLQDNFKNNLQVIEQSQREIQALNKKLGILQQQCEARDERYEDLKSQKQLEIRLVRHEYGQKLEEKQGELQELATMYETKMRKQVEAVSQRLTQELKSMKNQVLDRDETSRRLIHENNRLGEIIKQQKNHLLELQSHVTLVNEEKNAMSSKMALHEQELEGIKTCNSSWEDMLKDKLKETQKEKQNLEEEYSDYKLAVKEKLKKQKEDLNKKIIQMAEEKQSQIRDIAHDHKQMRYKLDKTLAEYRDREKEMQLLREEKNKLEIALNKYKDNELKSSFQKNQKQYEYLQKMFEQDKRDLKSQIDLVNGQKKSIKEELDQANSKRETTQKAVQRLKVELLNKSKENDEYKKENKKIKHEFQAKLKEYQINFMQLHNREAMAQSKPAERGYDSKGFDIIQSVRVQNDHSKIFTDDMGFIDDKFFQASSPFRSPKNKSNNGGFSQNREAQLMKKISELQLENQEYKNLIKKLREEAQGMKRICEQDKNREVSLYKDKANIYWEKANDKEQQVMSLREQYNDLKANYNDLSSDIKKYRQQQTQITMKDQQLKLMREQLIKLQDENHQLEEEIQVITKDRDLIEEISSDLRAQNHSLRELLNAGGYIQDNSKSNNFDPYKNSIEELPSRVEETIPFNQPQPQRQRIPKKLHDLVREKKMLSISGKRAAIEERMIETRMQHIGTDSQKEVLQKIKVKNRTPPKIANYAQMKKDKERRSYQLQTVSQKQVYERLKSRQNQVASPEKGINYLQLRSLQGLP